MATKHALVLAGGGIAGIAWETGILRGIADESPSTAKALLESDVLVGTSAGSTVAAQLSSGVDLDALFDRQTAAASAEITKSRNSWPADEPFRQSRGWAEACSWLSSTSAASSCPMSITSAARWKSRLRQTLRGTSINTSGG